MRKFLGALLDRISPKKVTLLLLDTETTGLDPADSAVLEFGGRLVVVEESTGRVLSARETYSALQDPGHPLDPKTVELTGITDAMVKGQSIDWAAVERLFERADIVVAHNAEFDRAFLEVKLPAARNKIWACSFRQMNWVSKGFADSKLVNLAKTLGHEFQAHRAMGDVDSLLFILSRKDPKTNTPYFLELIQTTRAVFLRVDAVGSAYEKKDLLKARGYYWNGKVWWRYLMGEARAEEEKWLAEIIYCGAGSAAFTEIPPRDRFRRNRGQP